MTIFSGWAHVGGDIGFSIEAPDRFGVEEALRKVLKGDTILVPINTVDVVQAYEAEEPVSKWVTLYYE
jgi:hypothetical protein